MDIIDSGLKRHAEENVENEASTSKKIQINYAVGANISAKGNAKVSVKNVTVNQHIHQQQTTPQQPPCDIKFQVADPIDTFRGRDKQLQRLKDIFSEQKEEKYNLVAVCGYGGIGKTEFARKYMKLNHVEFENVLWIYADFKDTMEASFKKLQEELKNKGYPCTDHQYVYKYFNNTKCMFVFDNAENMMNILPFLPNESNDSLFLITSQFQSWSPYSSIPLDKLDLESATNILKAVLHTHKIEISEDQLQTLAGIFEPIPLVLQIVAGFVCQEVIDLRSIGKEYNIDEIIEVLTTECEVVTQEFPDFFQNSYAKSVFKALSKTLEKLWTKNDKVSKLATQMIGIAAHLNADRIEEDMLKKLLKIDNSYLFNKSLAILVQFSLFQISYNIIIHRTVQDCVIYYCTQKLNAHKYYSQTLNILLNGKYINWPHHKLVLQRLDVENYLDAFRTFYDANKCRILYQNMAKSISDQILEIVLVQFDLIHNPEFLCEAAAIERKDIMQVLRNSGVNFNITDKKGFTALYYACLPRDEDDNCDYYLNSTLSKTWKRIQDLIKNKADVNSRNLEGNTIIHNICSLGKNSMEKDEYIFELCALMITVGGDPEITNNSSQTPVDLAREYELKLSLELLNAVISGNKYILHIAAECRQYEFVGFLTRDKVYKINEKDTSGRTVLHVLASLTQQDPDDEKYEHNLLYSTASLLNYGDADIDISIVNNSGETAAVVALKNKREKLADLFNAWTTPGYKIYCKKSLQSFPFVRSRNKADVNEQDDTGCTLLHAICDLVDDTDQEVDIVRLASHLVLWGRADVHIKNNAGETAADIARRREHYLLADFLELRASDIESDAAWLCCCCRKINGLALLFVAVKYKQFDLVKSAWWRYCFFNSATDVDGFPDESGCAVLHILCGYENPDVTDEQLISVIKDLNLELVAEYDDFSYHAAIGIAKQHGRDELSTWLTKTSVCDINDRDDSGCTELHRLSDNPDQKTEVEIKTFNKILNLVINCNADVNIVNNSGETAADVARRCNREMFADFLNSRADPGRIIYHTAAHRSKIEHFLFVNSDNSEHVNEKDSTECTLLHVLCDLDTHGEFELELEILKLSAHLVIQHGADLLIKNHENNTAADVARRNGQLLLADFLDTRGQINNLVFVAIKHKQFDLMKYAWWRYMFSTSTQEMFQNADAPGYRMIQILSALEDLNVTDSKLNSLIDYFDYMKHVIKYYTTQQRDQTELEPDISSDSLSDWESEDDTDDEDDTHHLDKTYDEDNRDRLDSTDNIS